LLFLVDLLPRLAIVILGNSYRLMGHYATSWKVTDSSPNEVIGFFNLPNLSSCTVALGFDSASNRNEYYEFSWGVKGVRLTKLTNIY
jgi:hypothetical protein